MLFALLFASFSLLAQDKADVLTRMFSILEEEQHKAQDRSLEIVSRSLKISETLLKNLGQDSELKDSLKILNQKFHELGARSTKNNLKLESILQEEKPEVLFEKLLTYLQSDSREKNFTPERFEKALLQLYQRDSWLGKKLNEYYLSWRAVYQSIVLKRIRLSVEEAMMRTCVHLYGKNCQNLEGAFVAQWMKILAKDKYKEKWGDDKNFDSAEFLNHHAILGFLNSPENFLDHHRKNRLPASAQ